MTRDDIVTEARSWLGTPYRHQASLKGIGCDCAGLVRGLWRTLVGPEPERVPAYTPDWAEAGGRELMLAAANRHFAPVALDAIDRGDLLLFRWRPGLPAKHAGILMSERRFIHAHEGAAVAEAPLAGWWRSHLAAAFRWPGLTDAD